MKKGKPFEVIIALIQSALKSDPNLKITPNAILSDTSGNRREIDVLLTTLVNNHPINIAIECKDYSRPVSIDKIDAFKSKCEAISSLNKLVFVSKSGFQKGALIKAKSYGIDLYELTSMSQTIIKEWFSMYFVRAMQVSRKVTNIQIDFHNSSVDDFLPTDKIIVEDGQKETSLGKIVQDVVNFAIPQKRLRSSIDGSKLPDTEVYEFTVNLFKSYLLRDDTKSGINSITVQVTDWYTEQPSEIRGDIYHGGENNEEISTFSVISNDGNIFTAVEISEDEIGLYMKVSPKESTLIKESIIQLGKILLNKQQTT